MIQIHIEYDDFGDYVEFWDEEAGELTAARGFDVAEGS